MTDAAPDNADDAGTGGATAANEGTDPPRMTLNTAVRRRRTDQAFFIRLSRAIAQNRRALERLSR